MRAWAIRPTWSISVTDGRWWSTLSRDLRAVHAAASKRGLTVAFAADTHLHADFLSGAMPTRRNKWNAGAGLGGR